MTTVYTHATTTRNKILNISISQESSLMFLSVQYPSPQRQPLSDFYHPTFVWSIFVLQINQVIEYVVFCVWLLLPNSIFWKIFTLLCISIVSSYTYLVSHHINISKCVCPFSCRYLFGLFPFWGYYEWSLWMFLYKSSCGYVFLFLLNKYLVVELLGR